MKTHKDLDVWKNAVEFSTHIYQLTQDFPDAERYGLTNQMRRAAVSVASNIAEGAARKSDNEFIHFLYTALGSLAECESQLIIAGQLQYTTIAPTQEKHDIIKRQLLGLIHYLKEKKKG